MNTIPFLVKFIHAHQYWASILLFLGVLIEGEIVLIVSGILIHQGALPLQHTLFIISSSALMKTVLGYSLGVWISKRWPTSKFLKYVEKRILIFLPKFKERPFWSIFISKFVYGVNHLSLIFAGFVNANFKLYIRAEIISTIIWLLGFLGIGYFFSFAAFKISHDIRMVMILIFVFIVTFVGIQKLISFVYDVAEVEEKL